MGLEKSDEFKEYIKQKSENSGRTLDEEKQSFENNLNMLRINQGPNTEKMNKLSFLTGTFCFACLAFMLFRKIQLGYSNHIMKKVYWAI